MLALPFVAFVAWRLLAPTTGGPPRVLVVAVSGTVAAMAVLLLVLWYEEAAPPGALYVPARLEDGRIEPSHMEPIVPKSMGSAVPRTTGQK
jgi:hypothetical protein